MNETVRNVLFWCVFVLIESLQALVVLALVFSFIPIPVSPLIQDLFPKYLEDFKPERESLFYHCWAIMVIAGQAIALFVFRKKLNDPALRKAWVPFVCVEAGWLFLMLFASFKFFVYGQADWAKHLLYVVIFASTLSKIFWKEISVGVQGICAKVMAEPKAAAKVIDLIMPLFVIAVLFVPNREAAMARIWIGDNLIHWDTTLMGQAWAWVKGDVLNIDVYTQYGLGMPIFVAIIAKTLGIFSYTGFLAIIIGAAILYFIAVYFYLRQWLNSVPFAVFGVIMALKWQVFHNGNYPFVFNYPYSSVCRYIFDIGVMGLILAHIRSGSVKFLYGAAALVGLSIFYISDTGVYLFLAFTFYMAWLIVDARLSKRPLKKIILTSGLSAIIMAASTLGWFMLFQGKQAFAKVFWANMSERVALFLAGHGDEPVYSNLVNGDYLVSLVGFIIPLVYIATLVVVVSLCALRQIHARNIMAAVLSVYGLGLYHYFVYRSTGTAYDTVCIPFVLVLTWLLFQATRVMSPRHAWVWQWALVGIAVFSLLTNHAFLNYPNYLNRSASPIVAPAVKWPNKNFTYYFHNGARKLNPMLKLPLNSLGQENEDLKTEADFKSDNELKEYFRKEFDFSKDAALIKRLTDADQRVPVLSVFEIRILMQANRRPFFYYFPLVDSSPRRLRIFPFSRLWRKNSLEKTIEQFETSKPEYVFMEKIYLTPQVPEVYQYLYPDSLYLVSYLMKNYRVHSEGEFLVALKRI